MLVREIYISKAKNRCLQLGMDPASIPEFIPVGKEILEEKCQRYHEILSVVKFFVRKLLNDMKGTPILVVITDEQGVVLEIAGDESIYNLIDKLGITCGIEFAEETVGISSISLALEYKQPISVVGDDHFHECLRSMVCYSVPFQYSDLGNILGTINIMTSLEQANDILFILLSTVVGSIERELLLRSQNRKLNILNQILMDTTNTGIILTDIKGDITEFNAYAESITGLKKEDLVGKPVADLQSFGKYIYNILQSHENQEDLELFIEKAGGENKTVCLFDGMPVYDERNMLIGAFAKLRDITERQKLESELAQLDRLNLIGEMAASIGHEVRNPMTTVRGYLQLFQRKEEFAKYGGQLAIMIEEIDRANAIITEFLGLAKDKALTLKNGNLNDCIKALHVLLQADAFHRGFAIRLELGDIPEIDFDEKEIRQMILNMVRNGMEAMDVNGVITIRTYVDNGQLKLAIEDSGSGIPDEVLPKLGIPFVTTKDGRTGLGLAICYRVAHRHGAKIKFSTGPTGTTFTISFRRAIT